MGPLAWIAGWIAITAGSPDEADRATVALVDGDTVRCSGVVVSPRVVLTAAHCVAGPAPQVFFGADLAVGGERIAIVHVRAHPEASFDLAMIVLAEAAPVDVVPWPVADAALPLDGATIRIVGFGATGAGDTTPSVRRAATTVIDVVGTFDFGFGPDPAQTCTGDAGGPALLDDVLVGVLSAVDPGCASGAGALRVDPFASTFIEPFVAETADGAAATGERCYHDGNCADGPCVFVDPDPRARYCSAPCDGDAACPDAMICDDGACRYDGPSPGTPGWPCETALDCASGSCLAPADPDDGDVRVCATACPCPDGLECRASATGADACFAPATPEGGCGCATTRRDDAALALLLTAGVAARRRRRRRRTSSRRDP